MTRSDRWIDGLSPEEADQALLKLLEMRSPDELVNARNERTGLAHVSEFLDVAKSRYENWGKPQGLLSGYPSIDAMTLGLVGGELIIISGYTSMGKTQLATNIAYYVASHGSPVLFATLEMSHAEITSRLMKIAEPNKIDNLPIFYQIENNINYRDVATLIKKAKIDGAKLVVLDHLNMMVRSIENQTNEVGRAVMELKKAAIKNDLPIILICHTRKVNDKVEGKRRPPELEDLKDTSAIAQDADIVLLIHRNLEDLEGDNDQVVVVLAKNRNRGIRRDSRVANFRSEGVKLWE